MISNSNIGFNVKKLIKKSGLKQYAVAERAGYDNRTFNAMLNGHRIIKAEEIPSIAKALGVTPNELFKTTNDQQAS